MRNSRLKGKVCPKSYTWLKDRTGISIKDILHILFFLQEINPGMPNGGRVKYIKSNPSKFYIFLWEPKLSRINK